MRPFLGAGAHARLDRLARQDTLLAFDFDGTLAPLVPQHAAARMRWRTSTLFAALCTRYPCVVISGRARDDVLARLDHAEPLTVIGNHGAEDAESDLQPSTALMREVIARLASAHLLDTVQLEDKQASIALHWPRDDAFITSWAALLPAALGSLSTQVRVVGGHRVLNLVPAQSPDKGAALRALARRERAKRVLFVGDDVTDEDAFALPPRWFTSVRVGFAAGSRARYFLADQTAIDWVLLDLLRRRPPTPS